MVILGIWLWWRGPRAAVPYLFATLLFALSVPMLLKAGLQLPRPGDYGEGWSRYGFPSWHAAMAVLLYGFVALLVARELSAERRWLAYGVALLPIVLISFSRLYLGVHWLSDVLGGLALAGAWLTIVGIAYRRHVVVALKWRPMLLLLFVSGALLWALHLANSDDEYRYQPAPVANYSIQQWQQGVVSQQLNTLAELTGEGDRQLNLQWLGERASILQQLKADGWQEAAEPSWLVPLNWLLPPAEGTSPRVLPHYHAGQLDGIRALRFEQGRWQLLRLWSLAQVAGQPLWQGKVASVEYQALLGLLYLPRSGEVVLAEQLLGWWPDGILMNDELRLQSRGE